MTGLPSPASGHSGLSGFEMATPITAFGPGGCWAGAGLARGVLDGFLFSSVVPSSRFECQTALGFAADRAASMNGFGPLPFPLAIASIARPEATERSCFRMASPVPSRAASSACLMSSQLLRLPPLRS